MKVYIVNEDHLAYEMGNESWYEVPIAVYTTLNAAKQYVGTFDDRDGWAWRETTGEGNCLREWVRFNTNLQWFEIDQHFSIQEWEVQEQRDK